MLEETRAQLRNSGWSEEKIDAAAKRAEDRRIGINASTSAIAAAVLPLKVEAIERAEKEARKRVEWAAEKLQAAGNDLRLVAPRPHGSMSRAQYVQADSVCRFFGNLTRSRQPGWRMGEPQLVDLDSNKIRRFVADAREDAAVSYDAFIAKLEEKIGPCISALLTGNHVWSYSILQVMKVDGEIERWKTQTIVNVSKLGKLFNQYPTRKIK